MIADVFNEQEIREMAAVMAGSSVAQLEQMKARLGEVTRMIDLEVGSRGVKPAPVEVKVVATQKVVARKGYVSRKCDNHGCKVVYEARQADLKRGWGRCCSKSCAASHKLRCNPDHGYLRSGARDERYMSEDEIRERDHQAALGDCELGWDGHKGSF